VQAMDKNIRPLAVNDIEAFRLFEYKNSDDIYCIGSVEKDKYIEVKESTKDHMLTCISYFNGRLTLEEIKSKLIKDHQLSLNVEQLYELLEKSDLLVDARPDKVERGEFENRSLQLAEVDITGISNYMKKIKLSPKYLFGITSIFVLFGLFNIGNYLPQFTKFNMFHFTESYILSVAVVLLTMASSIMIHEFAHGIVASHYGLTPRKMVVSLYYYFSPVIYLKIPGLYTLSRGQRVKVWFAGVYTNLVIASMMSLVLPYLSGFMYQVGFMYLYMNFALIIINLFPLLPMDGYFMMVTIFKMPNLRKRSFSEFRKFLKREKNNFNGIYIIYFILASSMLGYLILTQVMMIINSFMGYYSQTHSVWSGLMGVKVYLLIFMLVIVQRVRRFRSFIDNK